MNTKAKLIEITHRFLFEGDLGEQPHQFILRTSLLRKELEVRVTVCGPQGPVEDLSPEFFQVVQEGIAWVKEQVKAGELTEVE